MKNLLLYVPYSNDAKIRMDLSEYEFTLINLTDKHYSKPEIIIDKEFSIIKMHPFNSDVLILGQLGR